MFFWFGSNPYPNNNYPPPSRPGGDRLATAAMTLGILSAVTAVSPTVYPALILGSIGIVLALLSKGCDPKLASKAKIGVIGALIGILFTGVILFTSIRMVYEHPEILQQALDTFEEQYGISYEELIDGMLTGGELPAQND